MQKLGTTIKQLLGIGHPNPETDIFTGVCGLALYFLDLFNAKAAAKFSELAITLLRLPPRTADSPNYYYPDVFLIVLICIFLYIGSTAIFEYHRTHKTK